MNEWHIQSRAHTCQISGRHFTDKQPYFTLLLDDGRELKRMDVCEEVWKEQFAANVAATPGYVSHWNGVYSAPPPAPPEAIQKATAESLLRQLIEQNDPKHGPACFILAVMLERKRILKVKEQFRRDGQRVFIYEQPKTGDIFTITDPDLHLDQLETVQRDVADLLENGIGGAPPPPNPSAEAAVPSNEAAPVAEESPENQEAQPQAVG